MTERITLPTRLEISVRLRNLIKERKLDPNLADMLSDFAEERHSPSSLFTSLSSALIHFINIYEKATNLDLINEPNLHEYVDAIVGEDHPQFAQEIKRSLAELYRSQGYIISDID